jgi:hypothetical protein
LIGLCSNMNGDKSILSDGLYNGMFNGTRDF